MSSTISKMDDEWSVETTPRGYTPKRQKTDPDIKIKLTYPKHEDRDDNILHVLLLQTIMAVNTLDLRVLKKKGEVLKEAAVADLIKAAFTTIIFKPRLSI
jgi:hypothetical protein